MFMPKTQRVDELAKKYPDRIAELEMVFSATTNVYLDYANMRPWANKLGWHIEPKRLKQLLDSFDTVRSVKFYNGTLVGDVISEDFMAEIGRFGFDVHTKPVKKMKLSINALNIPLDSPDVLKDFIHRPLLKKFGPAVIEFLNAQLKDLNRQGVMSIENLKCNFDVEIGRDMLLDDKNGATGFALWSGDSDFADPVRQLLDDGKKVVLFATAGRVSSELSALTKNGLLIFDIQKIRDFICWKREMTS
jgi:uncharacterized LabA/DUF88 family protein